MLSRARARSGGLLVISGPAGIGKTALLRAAMTQAQSAGMRVLAARGSELESDFSFGVVRQLFESPLATASSAEREIFLTGAARRAAIALDAADSPESLLAGNDPAFAAIHGLYWLAINMSGRIPLMIAIDDLQWADPASLGYVLYLADRLAGLPIALVLSFRVGEGGVNADGLQHLGQLAGDGSVHLAPLSALGVRELLSATFGQEPDPRFTAACRTATGGNPFLLHELAASLCTDGINPDDAAADRVAGLGPRSIAHAVTLRLTRLGSRGARLARAAAILGDGSQLRHAAALARLELAEAAETADRLAGIGIFEPGTPLRFVHPIVRTAVHDDIPAAERGMRHAEAARILAAAAEDVENVCAHLLVSDPAGSAEVAAQLQAAAARALTHGAPASAASYLRRALAEAPDAALRAALLHELGRTEKLVRDPAAPQHLSEALELTSDPGLRPAVALDVVHSLFLAGQWDSSARAAHAALDELADCSASLRERVREEETRLQTWWAWISAYEPSLVGEFDRRLEELIAIARGPGPAQRLLAGLLVGVLAARGERRSQVMELLDHALDRGRLVSRVDSDSAFVTSSLFGAIWLDELSRVDAPIEQLLAQSRSRGSVTGVTSGLCLRCAMRTRRGDLIDAETDIRALTDIVQENRMGFVIPFVLYWGADALIERAELADIAALAQDLQLDSSFARTASGAMLREGRGRLSLAASDLQTASAELQAAGVTYQALRMDMSSWRSALALAISRDDQAEALRLASTDLENGRRLGAPRLTGVALRTLGVIEGGQRGLDRLVDSVAILQESEARLEHARALVELGAALRRANQRIAAREPLRSGLELAFRCGAGRLAQRASDELSAVGARPRKAVLSGLEALTPSERRVAELAASGMSNPEIAQSLFVTINTVEGHLRHAYQKLSINSRKLLPPALKAAAPGRAPADADQDDVVAHLHPEVDSDSQLSLAASAPPS